MENSEILKHVDHTLLKAYATYDEIRVLCSEALVNQTASVCIPPSFIKRVKSDFPTLKIATVIGFPLGYNTTAVKVFEAKSALLDGADEIDMVINIGLARDKQFDLITDEIRQVKEVCGEHILKVIIETCYLDRDEKVALCDCINRAGADYIKTSTGFGSGGATIDDVKLFREYINSNVKIKAAGGIRTKEEMETFLDFGVERIGCSAAVKLLGK